MKNKNSLTRQYYQKINKHFSTTQRHLQDIVAGFSRLVDTLKIDIEIQYDRLLQARKTHKIIITLITIQIILSSVIIYKLWS